MGIFTYRKVRINLEGASPLCAGVTLRQKLRGVRLEALVSRRGGNREVTSEESDTKKLGTDEQEPYTEAYLLG